MKFGLITEPSVWLYGEDFISRTDELLMGWAVGILTEQSGWVKVVTHYGYTGYLREGTYRICSRKDLCDRDECGKTAFVSRAFADILAEPNVQSALLKTLGRGCFFTLLREEKQGYRKVLLADGKEGYISRIAYQWRLDHDGYLYEEEKEGYFLRQKRIGKSEEPQFRRQLVSYAKSYLGTQYRWAGKSAEGIDCSGLTFMCYLMCGILIYRDASVQCTYPVRKIPCKQAKPGDLLYFPGHIAMYVGRGKYIHATGNERSFGCVLNSLLPKDADFRQDLADSLTSAGSIV